MRFVSRSVLLILLILAVTATVLGCTPAPDEVEPEQTQDAVAQTSPTTAPTSQTDGQSIDDPETRMSEEQRWCQAWALDNLDPLVYVEFLALDPLDMDDIDRTIWHGRLREANLTCAMYWREPLSKQNAHLSNEQYRTICLESLTESADKLWSRFAAVAADPLRDREDNPAYDVPNQYVRILRWVHLTGDQLLAMDERTAGSVRAKLHGYLTGNQLLAMNERPYQLLERLAHHRYDRVEYEHPGAVSHFTAARSYYGEDFLPEWWGLEAAVREVIGPCSNFRPQVFTGHWIPQARTPTTKEPAIPDELADDVKRLLEGPLYLDKP